MRDGRKHSYGFGWEKEVLGVRRDQEHHIAQTHSSLSHTFPFHSFCLNPLSDLCLCNRNLPTSPLHIPSPQDLLQSGWRTLSADLDSVWGDELLLQDREPGAHRSGCNHSVQIGSHKAGGLGPVTIAQPSLPHRVKAGKAGGDSLFLIPR